MPRILLPFLDKFNHALIEGTVLAASRHLRGHDAQWTSLACNEIAVIRRRYRAKYLPTDASPIAEPIANSGD
jgi:hypothetical protein